MKNRVEVLHGVNLNTLGRRDSRHYPQMSLTELEFRVKGFARELGLEVTFFQSNHEGEFVEHLQRLPDVADAVLVNAGAWTHYSWAIRDALEVAGVPAVEVHLSDVSAREGWRSKSVFDDLELIVARIHGKGPDGYREALELLAGALRS